MKKFWFSEGALIFVCAVDEFQLYPELLPHWLKISLPVLGMLAVVIKMKTQKRIIQK